MNDEYVTDADRVELAQITATMVDARKRRARVMTRIRQRAYAARKAAE